MQSLQETVYERAHQENKEIFSTRRAICKGGVFITGASRGGKTRLVVTGGSDYDGTIANVTRKGIGLPHFICPNM